MILPISLLRQFVDVNELPAEIAETFYDLGFPTEKIGKDFIDLEITPNRGDCTSVLGLAREYAAIKSSPLKMPPLAALNFAGQARAVKFELNDPQLSPRYAGLIVENVTQHASPTWLKDRLKFYNVSPQNFLVDLTNYLTFELGMPMHAFDLDKIKDGQFIIRSAQPGEKIKVLTGQEFTLPEEAIVVENNNELIDLCGIVGSELSKIEPGTKRVLLQAAIFPAANIASTVRKIGFSTEASYRFERNVDYNLPQVALLRAAQIIKEDSGYKITEAFDIKNAPNQDFKIKFDFNEIVRILGTEIPQKQAEEYLKRLGFSGADQDAWQVPSWRQNDVTALADLVEEIARLYGYAKLERQDLSCGDYQSKGIKSEYEFLTKIKFYLYNLGFCETCSYNFISQKELKLLDKNLPRSAVEVANPLSAEFQYLRPSLILPLLKAVAANPWWPQISLFEAGKVFGDKDETLSIGLITTDFFPPEIQKKFVDQIVNIGPADALAKFYKLRRKIKFLALKPDDFIEFALPQLATTPPKNKYQPISKFPPVVFDLAFIVAQDADVQKIKSELSGLLPQIFIVEIFDIYQGPQIPKGKISLAIRVVCQDLQKSMTQVEADEIRSKIVKRLNAGYKAELRS